ncbi:MAG: hypothetical protein KKG06_06350 [Bacteroidetes bacterium]|nr:hypothetical protein [Bacteroidota bacterium]MBU1422788.1 hypothetical protein [Bacteroidota bacterium]
MKTSLIAILFISSFLSSFAQLNYSLDTDVNPKSIALGESSVANIMNPNLKSNPASLIGVNGINVYYSYRGLDQWEYSKDYFYYNLGLNYQSRFGFIGFDYSRANYGELTISTFEHPEGIGKAQIYNHTFTLGYSNYLSDDFAIGVNLKTFTEVVKLVGDPGSLKPPKTNVPIILDLGFIYKLRGFIEEDFAYDQITVGTSLQNYGTDYRTTWIFSGDTENQYYIKLPRFFRIGFAYNLSLIKNAESNYFNFLASFEYRNVLNKKGQSTFWGIGFQSTFLDILSLRMGGIMNPFSSIYGEEKVFTIRYGVGVNLPLKLIGINYPMKIGFNYTLIPLKNYTDYWYFIKNQKKNLTSFELNLSYDGVFF